MDPMSIVTGVSAANTILGFVERLKKIAGQEVISAYFSSEGERKEGDERIVICKHDGDASEVWWYSVESLEGYVFQRFPVVESGVYEVLGTVNGESNPDARFWRYVPKELEGRIYGGESPSNAKVDFIVVGYRPKDLIEYFEGK